MYYVLSALLRPYHHVLLQSGGIFVFTFSGQKTFNFGKDCTDILVVPEVDESFKYDVPVGSLLLLREDDLNGKKCVGYEQEGRCQVHRRRLSTKTKYLLAKHKLLANQPEELVFPSMEIPLIPLSISETPTMERARSN